MPHTRDMKEIAYTNITEFAPIEFGNCCDERMMMCPACGFDLCVLCMDACDECGGVINFAL